MVGNKGNITARGVVGNKGNTTVGQPKVNAAQKRKSFKGNTVTGPSKRIAGIRSGLIRRAKPALVGKKRELVKMLGDEELRRAAKAVLFWTEHKPEQQALQRTHGGASQLAVVVHAGEASVQRVLEMQKLLQQVRDLGCYPQESRCGGVERLLARMPRRLAPPLCDPVWRDGQMLYVDNAFDPRGLSERVLKVTSCSRIKAQHAYKDLGRGVGSFNFGVVPHMGIPGMYLQTHNRNVLSSRVEREELRRFLWRRLRPQLEAVVPGWRIWNTHYLRQCRDIPALTVDGEALPWNGEQLNAFHAAVRHSDRHDARGLPCLVAFSGSRGGVLRVHGQNKFVDVATKPGGLLLFDSTFDHEVLAPLQAARAVDDKGRHAPGRISVVWMANMLTHEYQTPEWIRYSHDRL